MDTELVDTSILVMRLPVTPLESDLDVLDGAITVLLHHKSLLEALVLLVQSVVGVIACDKPYMRLSIGFKTSDPSYGAGVMRHNHQSLT